MTHAALSIRACTGNVGLRVTRSKNALKSFKMVAVKVLYFTLTCVKVKFHVSLKF
jgi:hypothetical protein